MQNNYDVLGILYEKENQDLLYYFNCFNRFNK